MSANEEILRLHQAYKRLMATEDGALVLDDLERRAFVRSSAFHLDPFQHAHNEGRRSLVLHIKSMCDDKRFKSLAKDVASE